MYSEFLEKLRKERELAKEKALENINDILDKLKNRNIKKVEIQFWGGGDSGEIDNIFFTPTINDAKELEELTTEVSDWAYLVLDSVDTDWYNNEGGNGNIIINVEKEEYSYEIYVNIIESQFSEGDVVKIKNQGEY